MVAPSAGPSRGTTPTPTLTATHASGDVASSSSSSSSSLRTGSGLQPQVQQHASKLNPHSASFSYLQQQQQQQQSMSPYATFSPPMPPPPPPPSNRNGMYGAPVPSAYSPYPISSANTGGIGMHPGPSGGNGNGNGSWHMPPPPRGAPGQQQQYQAMLHHAQQHQMPYYPAHAGMGPPPSQNRIPPPPPSSTVAQPPPSAAVAGANGILLPLSSNPPLPHHLATTMAAAGFGGMPMSPPPPPPPPPHSAGSLHHHPLAAGPQQHLAHSQHVPHPQQQHQQHQQHQQQLLPPFSPQMRSLPPSTVAGPRLMPAPSLPVSPATPLPPQTVSPAPTQPSPAPPAVGRSIREAVAAAAGGEGQRPEFGDATSPPSADLASSSTNNAVPSEQPHAAPTRSHGHGIRRRKDHLPAPRDAEALTFATHLKIPREYQGMFGTPSSSIGLPGGSSATGATAAGSRSRRSAAGTASPSPSRAKAAPSSVVPAASAPTPVASTSTAPIPAPASAAPEAAAPPPAPQSAEPIAGSSSSPTPQPSEPPVPSTPKAAPLSPELTPAPSLPTSPRTPAAASAVKRSWADLVRPPAGSQPKGVNGVLPISATVGGSDLSSSSAPRAADTLLSLLTRAPSHEHSPHAPTPRGLINNGNLCFANSTLQALVYCGSFWNLMSTVERSTKKDLREAMGPAVTNAGQAGVPADKTASERSAVEATIAFLAEFRTDEAPAAAFDPILNRKSASASASASGTTTPKPPYNNNNHHLPSSPSVSTPAQPGPLSPTPIHDALRHNPRFDAMRRGTQEDAEEFLGFFLETLHEEILKLVEAEEEQEARRKGKGKAVAAAGDEGWEEVGSKGRVATTRTTATKESPITCIFGGKLRSVLRCPGQKDSVTIEPFQRLQLDIQPDHVLSIEDALVQLTTPESLPDFMTSRGVRTQDASKQVFVEALPPVLLLHLKRFLYDEVGGVQKSTKKVAYGTELTIDERIMSAPLRAQVGRDGAKYELFGVVYHHGLQASGGHYTVAARRGYHSPAWLELDDTHMRSLTGDEVAVSSAAPTARRWESVSDSRRRFEDEDGDQKNAYLLLYAKSS
ncbi:hypothetical protein BMF94_5390 [Rhodotorula taiwanensis]|uniref:ubiquitinyl hydrolase 1 n=1 Tax=Rhodotorula taiwanensis TaxID=741276 RepID=A0A2S5B4D6_9BASI|nr:hypothetical protein BMF94_5390 [Rhodotorula taiwanensis]